MFGINWVKHPRLENVFESTNTHDGVVTISKVGEEFFGRDTNGMLVSQFGSSFEECSKLMESCFTFSVKVK